MRPRTKGLAVLWTMFWILTACSGPPRGTIILCAGDSLTEMGYPRHLRRLLVQEGYRVQVHNYGRKGNNSREYLKFLEEKKKEIARLFPDIILLQLGTNDARSDGDFTPAVEFDRTMRKIISIFEELSNREGQRARILLATIPPLPENLPPPFGPGSAARVVDEINPIIRRIAADRDLTLVDNYSLFLENSSLLADVHPTEEGYKLLARNWCKHIKPYLR